MANVNVTVTDVTSPILKTSKGNIAVQMFHCSDPSTQFSANDYLWVNESSFSSVRSLIIGHDKSNEVFSGLNIGDSLTFGSTTLTRSNTGRITITNDSYRDSADDSGSRYEAGGVSLYCLKFSDGVISARLMFQQQSSGYSIDYSNLFALFTATSSFYNSFDLSSGARAIGTDIENNYLPTDPYAGAGDSTTDGGDGTFDGSSDPVPVPSLPSVGATDTGFITLFVPSQSQLKSVADYLWGGLFDLSTYKRLFEDPMDCILGLSVVPVNVPTSGSATITVGNIELSGITLPVASQQYMEIDCGTIDFTHRYFGSYLDFEPYTKMSLFVPYSGVHSVSADDIIGKIVGLKYHIDILTGSLVAFLTCGDSVLYEFNGACASNIPVNSMNYASTIENAIRIAVNIGTTVATAGASAPVQGISQAQQTARNIGTGISLAGSTTEGALSLKPNIDRAGSLGGTTGLMGNQTPYFIITRPRLCKPKNQDFFQGYPSFIQTSVGDLIGKGFTSFTNIIIAESFMTDAENEELESILQGGVYL